MDGDLPDAADCCRCSGCRLRDNEYEPLRYAIVAERSTAYNSRGRQLQVVSDP